MWKMSTKVHGVVDYAVGAALMALPRSIGLNRRVGALLESSGAAAAMYSAVTNYELGLVRALPMKAHLTLDALSGGMLLGAAAVLEDEDRDDRALLAAIGAFEIAAALMTESTSTTELNDRRDAPAQASRALTHEVAETGVAT
jgi:hypothetical protein